MSYFFVFSSVFCVIMFYRVSFILSIIEYKATKSQAKNREKATAWQKTANYLSIGVNNFIINFDSFKFLAGFLFLFSHFYGVNLCRFSHFYCYTGKYC